MFNYTIEGVQNPVKITAIRTPAAVSEDYAALVKGYDDWVGQIVSLKGNAYTGFMLTHPDGEERHPSHYFYRHLT